MTHTSKPYTGSYDKIVVEEADQAKNLGVWMFWNFGLKGKDAIDIGCGPGIYVDALAELGVNAIGIDPSPDALNYSKRVQTGSIFDKLDKKYDMVTCLEVLEHLQPAGTAKAINQLADAIKPGGYMLFSAGQTGQGGNDHINCRPKECWNKMLTDVGFIESPTLTKRILEYVLSSGPCLSWLLNNATVYYMPLEV